jgi:hypothetical protein
MKLNVTKFRVEFRRYASRQKQKLIHRALNPSRYLMDLARAGLEPAGPGAPARPIRMVLVSDRDAYCSEQQFNPFSTYRRELRTKLRLVSLQLVLNDVLKAPKLILSPFDIIGLKLSYCTTDSEALRIVRMIREAVGSKRIIYFDGDDDLGIQWSAILPYVDLYFKKHLLRDRRSYLKRFVGKSNLHDYVHHKYGYAFSARDYASQGGKSTVIAETGPVSTGQLGKLSLGYNLALDRIVMELYKSRLVQTPPEAKKNDIIFRGKIPDDWSYYLRKDIEPVLRRLGSSYRVISPTKRVTPAEYYSEMTATKICISPFGYGEICWRDFEAILCGCLLIKPNMDHVDTNPDIFRPFQTYVPVKWDFSDLEEKCTYYLSDDSKREAIVTRAFQTLNDFYKGNGFIESIAKMLSANPEEVREVGDSSGHPKTIKE